MADTGVLAVAAEQGRILLSHDAETMPAHFGRLVQDSTSAGLVIIQQKLGLRQAIEEILHGDPQGRNRAARRGAGVLFR